MVAFELDAPSDVQISLVGSGALVTAAIRRANCDDAEAEVECATGFDPSVTAFNQPAGIYYAFIEGGDEAVTVTVEAFSPASFEDSCDGDATTLSADRPLTLSGNTTDLADSVDGTACDADAGGKDAVLRFRLDADALVSAVVTEADAEFEAGLSLRPADCGGAPISCGAFIASAIATDLVAGEYALVLDGVDADASGQFTVSITAE